MRVCFLSRRYWPAVSGMSVYADNLLRQLASAGHEVTLAACYRDDDAGKAVYGGGPPPASTVPDGVEVLLAPSLGEARRPADFEGDVAALTGLVVDAAKNGAGFDVVHSQYGYPTGLAGLRAARLLGLPAVVSIQGGDGHWVGECCDTHRRALGVVLRESDAVLIGSASFRDEVVGRTGVAASVFEVLPGATDTDHFQPGHAHASDVVTLLYHGRVDRRKGVLDLLDALPLLTSTGWRLVISGLGPDSAEVAARAAGDDRITVTGPVSYSEAPGVYAGADVFVSPTYSEGFSNTVLEAMATGVTVVSCDAVGVVDAIRDGDNGLLVPPGDVPALAAALDRVIVDAGLRRRLAAVALREVRERYSWPVLARSITDTYDRLAGGRHEGMETPVRRVGPSGVDVFDDGPIDLTCRYREAPHLL